MTTIVKDGVIRTPSGFKVKPTKYTEIEKLADSIRNGLPRTKEMRFSLDCLTIFEGTLPKNGYPYRTVEIDEIEECAAFTITAPEAQCGRHAKRYL